VTKGRFRADLLARINLWTFSLPGLSERSEDIEPNLEYELERFSETNGKRVTFNQQARRRFLAFAVSPDAQWTANFRDLNGAVRRMATLAPAGRITVEVVGEEIERLRCSWKDEVADPGNSLLQEVLGEETAARLDCFDRVQLAEVVKICRSSTTLSEAGRKLFALSRQGKKSSNDADRLRKYLGRFNLDWQKVRKAAGRESQFSAPGRPPE
jgi:transcriptional regulatory protein RtcR